jgi:peptide/nickel transport system permease protein
MIPFLIRRLIFAVVVLVFVTLMVFLGVHLLPGDPVLLYLSKGQLSSLTPDQIAAARHQFGLDLPLMQQYVNWVWGILHGDFGMSLFFQQKVGILISQRLPVTINISLIAFVLNFFLGITAGVISALRRGKALDTVITIFANIGITMPVFWLGVLLIYVFGLRLGWLPTYGYTSPFVNLTMNIRQLILPVICVMVFGLASIQRQTRSAMLEVIGQDYIRTAWSKGLPERTIIIRHIIKNGLIPVITLQGFSLAYILSGSVLMETIFSIPGIGRLAVDATLNQDYALVQGCVLVTAVMVIFVNLLVDIAYGYLDPRIRYA